MPARHVPTPPSVVRGAWTATPTHARTPHVTAAVTAARTGGFDLVVVGGVPGAGKTTAIAQATDDLAHVSSIDPEHVSWWLRTRLPGVPYRRYRWLVHLTHTLRILVHLLNGPTVGRRLVVHDPGTRLGRRRLFLGLARLSGWRTVLLYVDVDRPAAQDGQRRRGRVVRSFDEHWQSWERLRPTLVAAPPADPASADPASAHLASAHRAPADRASAHRAPADRASAHRASAHRASADLVSAGSPEPVLLTDRTGAAHVLRGLCLAG